MNPVLPETEKLKRLLLKSLRLNDPRLFESVYKLRNWMGERRVDRPRGYMSHGEAFYAYLAYYFPVHLGETFWILDQQREVFRAENFDEVWDLGSGPGTASVSYLLWLKKEKLSIPKSWHLLDSSQKALDLAEKLLLELAPKIRVQKHRVNVLAPEGLKLLRRQVKEKRLTLLSHFLNELGSGPRKRGEKMRLLSLLSGRILIVEPPLREPTMDLMVLRDELVTESESEAGPKVTLLAPCPKSGGRCPMLMRKLGWCYAQPPRSWLADVGLNLWEKELRRLSGTRLQDLGFSYLVYDRGESSVDLRPKYEIQISDTRPGRSLFCEGAKVVSRSQQDAHRGAYRRSKSSSEDSEA